MKPGDYIEIKTKDKDILIGLVMPSTDKNIINLKLDSGYNLGIDKKKVTSTKLLKKEKKQEEKPKIDLNPNPKLKTITILHTGGTIASKVSYSTGAVSPGFSPEDLILIFPELKNIANIKSKLIGNMFSEDMRFAHYNLMAKEIEKELNSSDGIILSHGTDTLAHSATALAFILENLNKPVILVGAQRSSDRGSSDAAMNLISAAHFIANSEYSGVAVCMHSSSSDDLCNILPPCKIRKMHTSRRDAFKTVNANPIATVSKSGEVKFLSKYHKKEHKDKLKLKQFNEKLKIGILVAHPNMFAFEVKNYSKFDGLIIESTGLGHFPVNIVDNKTKEHKLILNELKKITNKIPVVISSQCIFGMINMNVYDTGRKMQEAEILGNFSDMTTETAFIKLAWLLSNYPKKEIKNLISHNFRDELSPRIEYKEDFLE